MGASTFSEINTAVYNYIGGLLYGSYPELFTNLNRIVFSVTPDDESIFRRFEEVNKSTTKKVDLPAAAIILLGIEDIVKNYGPRPSYVGSSIDSSGKSSSGSFIPVKLQYKVRVFTETMSDLLRIMEIWILFISQKRAIHFHSELLNTELGVELVYEKPSFSTLPNVSERWGNRGYVYCMDVDFSGDGILALAPSASTDIHRILTLIATLSVQGKEYNMLEMTRRMMFDDIKSSSTETSSGTQL